MADYDKSGLTAEFIDIDAALAIIRRQWRIVLAAIAVAGAIGLAFAATAVPVYSATATLLIDRNNSQIVEQLSTIGGVIEDEASILSQVEVLQSETIGLAVVDSLKLTENQEFRATRASLLSSIFGTIRSLVNVSQWFSPAKKESVIDDGTLKRSLSDQLLNGLSVKRIGRTYALELTYNSTSPVLAAQIVNAVASAYLLDKLNSKYEATRRASDWLSDRIAELRQRALDTDLAVQKFRAEHNLISTGNNSLLSDQQLAESNSALILAQSETAKARARVQRIEHILATDDVDGVVTDILDSSVANDLRKKYLESSKIEAEITRRLGSNHIQAVRLRNEMQEYRRLMFQEISRIAQSYKSDLEVSEAKEKSLAESVAKATDISNSASETQVQLRELQREAETYKNMYQTFLQRYQEAMQQQSFPVTEARVISKAMPPRIPSKPNKPIILALFMIMGAAAGGGIAMFREFRDRFFRTGEQVRDVLGLEFLGNTPLIPNKPVTEAPESGHPGLTLPTSVARYAVDHPLSSFAETLRSTRLAIDLGISAKSGARIVGVVSALPSEGKSTISINLAQLLAGQGARVLLLDADIRNPGATRAMARHASEGLLEVLLEGRSVQDVLLRDEKTKLAFLPTVVKQRVPHSSELLTSTQMHKLLAEASNAFDYIIVDLPPLGPVVDARAMAGRIDGFIFVTEWGKTARRAVRNTVENEVHIRKKCLGVILNKVDTEKLKLYRAYGSSEYYHSRYTRYYHD
ncbi:succinoglycan biosynthesis transport protein ExoP [Agrobacterium tumefaciens]|uniref:polysaccharide biosynthesis tyrosine autokinase n=1 Tax=Agrobacterium tumefaciens TaxID=358 RepID=UPI000B3FF5E6|nr:polysaccharide biosynthesis tyrosine autokinase [Agrobacterium tumefaciens]MBP2510123.1 succinoglycan biosynthesis transport protein ExoP [Agrobacterium tumefaciens]MBP2519357.1 succinoglycan biosynthesis transport protein ExoP [Agrobacterium tumefaciens]MBP2578316.1 succinoglycan biosynthesis transport protein ExoP [Agrobacterium tumefaciens]MBP2596262.1 succinoglycan biosynthesis transport protein ExoP [Agrobacterium tumefaciens]NSY03136.1 polysaccharide biosynthesis tyrosine autokinase [